MRRRGQLHWLLIAAAVTSGHDSRAADRFEIQVYDGEANPPGVVSLENHVNFVDRGITSVDGPEAPRDHQFHYTLETALGILPFWEQGLYFQTAVASDGTLYFAGMKIRTKVLADRMWKDRLRFGANFELGGVPTRFERDQWSIEIRPIASLDLPYLRAAVNPILGIPLVHGAALNGPDFEPAVSVKAVLPPGADLGVEYYGDLGPIGSPLQLRDQEHYFYLAADFFLLPPLELNVGVGMGVTPASDPLIFKAIIGYAFGGLW